MTFGIQEEFYCTAEKILQERELSGCNKHYLMSSPPLAIYVHIIKLKN